MQVYTINKQHVNKDSFGGGFRPYNKMGKFAGSKYAKLKV